jgi:chemotaxis signal transduction protein
VKYQLKTVEPARQPANSQLLFRVSQWEFAVPSRLVRSIVPSPSIFPIPGVPAWLAGLLQSGGAATPVIDLRARLAIGSAFTTPAVIVIESPVLVGLLVDRVLDTALIRPSEIQPIRNTSTLPFRDFLTGAWRGRSRACYLLNVTKLAPEDFETHIQTIFSAFR